ncbi:MAG TPA: hypothetical protein VGF28_07585 [Thermoanaerobaculia bacterium]
MRTPGGWKTRRVEETEQGPVTVAGAPVPFDAAGTAFVRKIRMEGIAAAVAAFEAERSRNADAVPFEERTLNAAGYRLMAEGRKTDAIEVFKLNVRAYPQSTNVYDSLAEAHLETGDEAAAAMGATGRRAAAGPRLHDAATSAAHARPPAAQRRRRRECSIEYRLSGEALFPAQTTSGRPSSISARMRVSWESIRGGWRSGGSLRAGSSPRSPERASKARHAPTR